MSSSKTEMGGRNMAENDVDAGGVKPSIVNGSFDGLLTPELLYKMNKKIAQLTKVVYGLNTRGEELENQIQVVKESEEKTKVLNVDLQHRVNTFKAKIENEMGRLRDLENQAKQAQIWKLECENLQRRLEVEGVGDVGSIAMNHVKEELEQTRRREAALQFDLDQARHAITNLKTHHDFIMRERDAQQLMENEKIILEWQTRTAEVETRYKLQLRHMSDDMELLTSECNMLRERALRASTAASEEALLRDQLRMMQMQHETEKREWEMKLRKDIEEKEEERRQLIDEKLDLMRKIRSTTEERDEEREDLEQRLRSTKEFYEEQIHDLTANQDLLQRLVDDKEDEFEARLKTKVTEWKSRWDLAEGELREEIKKLQNEKMKLERESSSLRQSLENAFPDLAARIQSLEEELADKANELELKTKNFKVRIGMVENENRQYLQERNDLEKLLEEERERFKSKLKNQESLSEKTKIELLSRLQSVKESEEVLKETNKVLEEGNEILRQEKEELNRRIKEKEREWDEKLEQQVNATEARTRQRVERTWREKLKKVEDTATTDVERMGEEKRKVEETLKNQLEETKQKLNETIKEKEELKSKIKDVRQREGEKTNVLREVESQLREMRKSAESLAEKQKELADKEEKYQRQIDDLTIKLSKKQEEVFDLVEELKEKDLQEKSQKNSKEEALLIKIEDMKKQIKLKENIAESIRVELDYKKNETQICKMKMERLEDELKEANEKVVSLQEQNNLKARESLRLREIENKVKSLEEELRKVEALKKDLQQNLSEIEAEREEELKIVQDALDEAAQEREELITTFEKELKHLNTTNTVREQQMMEDFEWKLREMEKEHKKKLEEKERQLENTLQRAKFSTDDETRQKMEKMKSELNSKWEDKLRCECSRLKSELDQLHAEEKRLAVESMKVQKEQEMQALKKSMELNKEEMTKKISTLKDSLTDKDAYYNKEVESLRTTADRDVWDLRMKLQKLNESSVDKQQQMEEKHREEMERYRVDYEDRIREMESRLAVHDAQAGVDLLGQLEKEHKHQMQHLEEQHKLSMERLREELESDRFQAVEEARVIITKHHEYIETSLKEQLSEASNKANQYKEEIENLRQSLSRTEEVARSLRDDLESRGFEPSMDSLSNYPSSGPGLSSSQFSLSSSSGSQSSRTSQDRFYLPENTGVMEDDSQKGNNSGILGKVFGSGWFAPTKSREQSRRGSNSLSNKKTCSS